MNARTIQHPGIEINEIDLTEYKQTVTTNNAYVIGFTDKGPIYDYSWITTRSEFINLYGEPQTEAEKYLYYAVQSILNNGGTPIVGRMPYDNKQCKAYKALKIKYASILPPDKNDPESEMQVLGWTNDNYSAKANPLISLSDVGSYINADGEATLLDTLTGQNIQYYYKASDKYTATKSQIKQLTYAQLLMQLDSYSWSNLDLSKYSESDNNQFLRIPLENLNDAIDELDSIKSYLLVGPPMHDCSLSALASGAVSSTFETFTNSLSTFINEINIVDDVNANETHISSTIFKTIQGMYCLDNSQQDDSSNPFFYEQYKKIAERVTNVTFTCKERPINHLDQLEKYDEQNESEFTSSAAFNAIKNKTFETVLTEYFTRLIEIREYMIKQNIILDQQHTDVSDLAKNELKLLNQYVYADSKSHDKTISGLLNAVTGLYTSGLFENLNKLTGIITDGQADKTLAITDLQMENFYIPSSTFITSELDYSSDIKGNVPSAIFNNISGALAKSEYLSSLVNEQHDNKIRLITKIDEKTVTSGQVYEKICAGLLSGTTGIFGTSLKRALKCSYDLSASIISANTSDFSQFRIRFNI